MDMIDGEIVKSVGVALINKINLKLIVMVVVVAVVVYLWYSHKKEHTIKQKTELVDSNCALIHPQATIFVSVANLNDVETGATIKSIFDNAYCPRRVFVGVYQNLPADQRNHCASYKKMLSSTDHSFYDHVRVLTDSLEEAQGASHARSMIEQYLYRDEKYYLILDSHTTLTKNWDFLCIQQLERCLLMSTEPILTTIPEAVNSINRETALAKEDVKSTFIKIALPAEHHDVDVPPRIIGQTVKGPAVKPLQAQFWSSKFSFSLSSIIKKVPSDPELLFLRPDKGLDLIYGARLWTAGYDFFHPSIPLAMQVRHPHQHVGKMPSSTKARFTQVLFGKLGSREFGLGTKRSLAQWLDFTGLQTADGGFANAFKKYALLGIGKEASYEEIMMRYGSLSQFNKLVNSI